MLPPTTSGRVRLPNIRRDEPASAAEYYQRKARVATAQQADTTQSGKAAAGSSDSDDDDDVLVVVPLELAITPMRVLQEPLLGPECRSMFEQGHVDDRFLIILFLTFERLRPLSSWKP